MFFTHYLNEVCRLYASQFSPETKMYLVHVGSLYNSKSDNFIQKAYVDIASFNVLVPRDLNNDNISEKDYVPTNKALRSYTFPRYLKEVLQIQYGAFDRDVALDVVLQDLTRYRLTPLEIKVVNKETSGFTWPITEVYRRAYLGSCMHQQVYVKYYDTIPGLEIVTVEQNGQYIGRGLLWTLTNGKRYLDRMYPSDGGKHSLAAKQWAAKQGYGYKNADSYGSSGGFTGVTADELIVEAPLSDWYYPYMDTMRRGYVVAKPDGSKAMVLAIEPDAARAYMNEKNYRILHYNDVSSTGGSDSELTGRSYGFPVWATTTGNKSHFKNDYYGGYHTPSGEVYVVVRPQSATSAVGTITRVMEGDNVDFYKACEKLGYQWFVGYNEEHSAVWYEDCVIAKKSGGSVIVHKDYTVTSKTGEVLYRHDSSLQGNAEVGYSL